MGNQFLSGAYSNYTGANFTNANLQNAAAGFATYTNAVFTGANLAGTSFEQAELYGVNLAGKDLRTVGFNQVKLSDANLSGADLSGNAFSGSGPASRLFVRLDRTNFSNATMIGTEISAGVFQPNHTGTIFTNANLESALLVLGGATDMDFTEALLPDATLQADFVRGSFRDADLIDADLSRVGFFGTDLTGALLSAGTLLSGTRYDESTLFPSGGDYASPPWGLPNGNSPWNARMVPAPEPSVGLLLMVGVSGLLAIGPRPKPVPRGREKTSP